MHIFKMELTLRKFTLHIYMLYKGQLQMRSDRSVSIITVSKNNPLIYNISNKRVYAAGIIKYFVFFNYL